LSAVKLPTSMASGAIHIISKLLNPIPQYVLGCLPAIAIIGASPKEEFTKKLVWVLRCLGCPFTGLLYSCNVGRRDVSLCVYWLSSEYFKKKNEAQKSPNGESKEVEEQQPQQLDHRPIGIYTMSLDENQDEYENIMIYIKRCTARASVLERFSSSVSIYYIVVGVIAAISRTTGQFSCEDWPYLSLLLSWTIPAVFKRTFSGTLVVKDPNDEFESQNTQIIMKRENKSYRKHKFFTVTLVAFVSIVYPWIAVFLAYYTPPVGFYCRSKYLTVFCSVWSFNSFLAFINHLYKEKDVEGNLYMHFWFSLCGFILAILLFILALFTNNVEWWSLFNDPNCSTSCTI
jgi:hypothetical protein